ncbi:MAG: ComEC family competence protein [Williamsia sp.]|nr:ComEC family competence protein [Williamsia sp.]
MTFKPIPVWKEAPFVRLVIPFVAGILLYREINGPATSWWLLALVCASLLGVFIFLRSFIRFRYYQTAGILIHTLLLMTGGLVTYYADSRHQPAWIGYAVHDKCEILVSLDEPLHRLAASYKAIASVEGTVYNHRFTPARGKIYVYFAAGQQPPSLSYQSRLLFSKPLEEIKNAGNPGGFDYKQYCAFQHIYHQVYLRSGDYVSLPEKKGADFTGTLFAWREKIIRTLQQTVAPAHAGLAEALLIGYKDDLDKELVQSYANTGVVHIIAISGLHLGLIYWLLVQLFGWIKIRRVAWLKLFLIIGALWIFALLTGGAPSVMRSALMFTFVAAGQLARRRASIYNSLAASAFLLLCYNPYWLWDAGFQLSYAALLSIVMFMRPLYNCFYVTNLMLDALLKMLATSLAAQILTAPLSIYLFHQFPLSFLLTNLVAVPLSSLVVLAEIGVCVFAKIHWLAHSMGIAVSLLISGMNRFVVYMEKFPFSVWSGLQISLLQTGLLYAMIAALCCWWRLKKPFQLCAFLGFMVVFLSMRSFQFSTAQKQARLIVYNIPRHSAINLVSGRHAALVADSALLQTTRLIKTSVEPAATVFRFQQADFILSDTIVIQGFYFEGRRIILCNGFTEGVVLQDKIKADIVIVSGANRLPAEEMGRLIDARMWVLDSSVPAWKVKQWKETGQSTHLACYPVSEKGAFVFQAD